MDDYRDDHSEITGKCERLYPETTSEFKNIMKEQYLLFCKNGNKQVNEFDARQLAYLQALAENLKTLTSELHTAWAPQGGNYVSEITLNGPLKLYPDKLSAYEEITNAMVGICDEVANGKINDVFINLDSMGEESPFAKNSITDFTNNIKGVQMVYQGSSNNSGMVNFVRTFNLSLDARIKQKMNTALSALSQITDPFGQAIFTQPIQVQNAIDAINNLKTELETGLLPLVQVHAK
jgi:predicted lipoprotein